MRFRLFLLLLVACGGNSSSPDAALTTDSTSSIDVAFEPGTITVSVEQWQSFGKFGDPPEPVSDVSVYFASAGTVTTASTGADGVARYTATAPTDVTVAFMRNMGEWSFGTFLAVPPGLTLRIRENTFPPTPPASGTFTISMPAMTGATSYGAIVSCGINYQNNGGQQTLATVTDCNFAHSATIVAWASETSQMPPIGYSTLSGVELATALNTTITMPAFQPVGTISLSVSGLPASITQVNSWSPGNRLSVDPLNYARWNLSGIAVSGGAASASMPIIPFGDDTFHLVTVRAADNFGFYRDYSKTSPSQDAIIDGSQMVRPIHNMQFDNAARTITWVDDPEGLPPNLFVGSMQWTTTDAIKVTETFFGPPPSGTVYMFPTLPAEIGALAQPPASATWSNSGRYLFQNKTYEQSLSTMLFSTSDTFFEVFEEGVGPI